MGKCSQSTQPHTTIMPEKQLELSKRSAFFKDPFFSKIRDGMLGGSELEKRLSEFSAKTMGLSGAGLGEAAHNVQVSVNNDKFQVQLELPGFSPEDFTLKTKDDVILLEAVHETKNEDGSTQTRNFSKEIKMPAGVQSEQLGSTYSGQGILTITAPRVIDAPEGAEVSEAMKAQSQAFVTDDGTSVRKDEKASNQSIAATTQSEDGSTVSSFKSTSSSSSSSTIMSSGSPISGSLMSGMGGFDKMPSLRDQFGQNKLGKDDMMSKMMSNMGSMSMGTTSSKTSSSSFSSSSSTSSKSVSSSNFGGGMNSLPPMRGMEMPGLDFEELSSMPPSSKLPKQEYTVTSPPPSSFGDTFSHKVKTSGDGEENGGVENKERASLKLKEGSDFKVALNMQQFSPDDITIKLNGQDLTIEAQGSGEKFSQKHFIPYNVDLDAVTSSFSSDGVLVIRAPKKN